jgi:RNA polymerase sigma-70 factor (ECF subfamily)
MRRGRTARSASATRTTRSTVWLFPPGCQGRAFRLVPTGANRRPAVAAYLRASGESAYRLTSLHVLRVEGDRIAEITTFSPELRRSFGLPDTLLDRCVF